jgi:hypothetical protein
LRRRKMKNVAEVRWSEDNGGLIKVISYSGAIDINMGTVPEARMIAERLWGRDLTEVEVYRGRSWAPS